MGTSSRRIKSKCAVSQRCSSCIFRHMDYTEELRVKVKQVSDSMIKIASLTAQGFENVFEVVSGAEQ
ncbi:MAG: hypothetical protein HUJ51_04665 [Eggerthellaceae bacterium]|nr:hypothetical protein [Eggerthellaceae bacterium]